jgi:spore photoproduct lyase
LASCQYCFVHTYFDDPFPTIFTNAADMDNNLRAFLADNPGAWISTGEFMDSLQLDRITGYTERIMETMAGYSRATLELRTKHSAVDHLPRCPHSAVIFSFSVNPPEVTEKIESGSAGFDKRLEAAAFLYGRGYRIALRIDPIITAAGFLESYEGLAEAIEKTLGWKRVERVFLGVLRFDHGLMRRLARGKTSRKFLDAEYVPAPDGKYRLYKQARVAVYRDLLAQIRRYNPAVAAALVMEPDYVHTAVTGTDERKPAASRKHPWS